MAAANNIPSEHSFCSLIQTPDGHHQAYWIAVTAFAFSFRDLEVPRNECQRN